jgi:hypothetical protein
MNDTEDSRASRPRARQEGATRMTQLSRDDLDGMTAEEIVAAYDNEELAELLGATPEEVDAIERAGDVLSRVDIEAFAAVGRHDLIVNAADQDRIDFAQGDSK